MKGGGASGPEWGHLVLVPDARWGGGGGNLEGGIWSINNAFNLGQ